MTTMNRRSFFQTAAASYMVGGVGLAGAQASSEISETGSKIKVAGRNYGWMWDQESDRFQILDQNGHAIATGGLQPAVLVQAVGKKGSRRCTSGRFLSRDRKGNRVTWTYAGVNVSSKVSVTWRFDQDGPWLEPVVYESGAAEDVVSLSYFAEGRGTTPWPSLRADGLVLPGICESEAVSPITMDSIHWDLRSWLGRGATGEPGLLQQWGLPAHYFCGFRHPGSGQDEEESLTHAFCCGLAELPSGDLFLEQKHGRASLRVNYHSELWRHLRGPRRLSLGATLFWAFGPNYYEAIRNYYRGLLKAGIIKAKINSERKNAAALAPQWCTWGEQVTMGTTGKNLDETALTKMYEELKASGLQAGMLSIDDKWEGRYGNLTHSAKRFPHFEKFLDRVRAEGYRIGMWAAFMRCENPADLGLSSDQMLHQVGGKPYVTGGSTKYYILDFTHPEVAEVLRKTAKAFIRRYRPDLVKFDFGYEIPALDRAAPYDMRWAGEKLLWKGLEVVVKAMQEENPDIVLMYYHLSPLFNDFLDLHSPDDLFLCRGEYALGTNRRFFFSSLCGEFGMPTYGSSGYDWVESPETWFDSVVVGTLGSLGTFGVPDEAGSTPTPERLVKYNGLTHLVRRKNNFNIMPLDAVYDPPASGAHTSSWARSENGELVLLALRKGCPNGQAGAEKLQKAASTTASIVVASKTNQRLSRSPYLAAVPFGDGELTIQREGQRAASVEVGEHYFGGGVKTNRATVREGVFRLPFRERAENGSLVEWVEMKFRAE